MWKPPWMFFKEQMHHLFQIASRGPSSLKDGKGDEFIWRAASGWWLMSLMSVPGSVAWAFQWRPFWDVPRPLQFSEPPVIQYSCYSFHVFTRCVHAMCLSWFLLFGLRGSFWWPRLKNGESRREPLDLCQVQCFSARICGSVHFSGAPAGMFVKSLCWKVMSTTFRSFRYIQIYSDHSALRSIEKIPLNISSTRPGNSCFKLQHSLNMAQIWHEFRQVCWPFLVSWGEYLA